MVKPLSQPELQSSGKSVNLSRPQFSYLQNGGNNAIYIGFIVRIRYNDACFMQGLACDCGKLALA